MEQFREIMDFVGTAVDTAGVAIMVGAAYTGGTLAGANFVKYLPSACRP
jgi:hypothetical protein